jgi:hypothetical protein
MCEIYSNIGEVYQKTSAYMNTYENTHFIINK